jgi:hypothetical protein
MCCTPDHALCGDLIITFAWHCWGRQRRGTDRPATACLRYLQRAGGDQHSHCNRRYGACGWCDGGTSPGSWLSCRRCPSFHTGAAQGQYRCAATRDRRSQVDPPARPPRCRRGEARGLVDGSVHADRAGRTLLWSRHAAFVANMIRYHQEGYKPERDVDLRCHEARGRPCKQCVATARTCHHQLPCHARRADCGCPGDLGAGLG